MASRIKDYNTWSAGVDKIDIEGIRITLSLKVVMSKQTRLGCFMSQSYWVEVKVEVELILRLRLIWGWGWNEFELKFSWNWV